MTIEAQIEAKALALVRCQDAALASALRADLRALLDLQEQQPRTAAEDETAPGPDGALPPPPSPQR